MNIQPDTTTDILNITLQDVKKDGFNDSIILKDGRVFYINEYDILSPEYTLLQKLRREYRSFGISRFDSGTIGLGVVDSTNKAPLDKSVLELLNEPDYPQPYLIEGLFPRGEFIGVTGKSGVNKSTFCRQLGLSIVTRQTTFCGFVLRPMHGKVMYVYSEDGDAWLRRYLRRNCEGILHYKEQLLNMWVANMNKFDDGVALISWLRERLIQDSFDLIVFDSFSDLLNLFNGKLNDNTDVRKIVRQLEFTKSGGCCVLFNHHVSDKSSTIGSFQGATAFRQIVRTQIEITEKGNQRVVSVEKNSYGVKAEPLVFDLTENFLFEPTGETMSRKELSELVANVHHFDSKPVGKPKIAPCTQEVVREMFIDSTIMTTSEIKYILKARFAISDKTSERWIGDVAKLGFIVKARRGEYVLGEPSIINTLSMNIDGNNDANSEHADKVEVNNHHEVEPSMPYNNIDGNNVNRNKDEIFIEPEYELNKPFINWRKREINSV